MQKLPLSLSLTSAIPPSLYLYLFLSLFHPLSHSPSPSLSPSLSLSLSPSLSPYLSSHFLLPLHPPLTHTQLKQKLSLHFHISQGSNLVTMSTSVVLHVELISYFSGPIEGRPTTAPQTATVVSVSILSSPLWTLSLRPATCPSMGFRQQLREIQQLHGMWHKM